MVLALISSSSRTSHLAGSVRSFECHRKFSPAYYLRAWVARSRAPSIPARISAPISYLASRIPLPFEMAAPISRNLPWKPDKSTIVLMVKVKCIISTCQIIFLKEVEIEHVARSYRHQSCSVVKWLAF